MGASERAVSEHASGNHDFRAATQRFGHRKRAEIDVGASHMRADGGERLAGIHILELDAARQKAVQPIQ